jgi:hypothetical protein
MTTEPQIETNENTRRRPTHLAYWVRERGENKKGEWHPIGVAWSHADGKGVTIKLDLQPLDGRITLRVVEDKKE